eukprot:8991874-Ditylum_brightwellii.AAC.2
MGMEGGLKGETRLKRRKYGKYCTVCGIDTESGTEYENDVCIKGDEEKENCTMKRNSQWGHNRHEALTA